ncbi:MAG: LacI family DNA-binding transcriptional regulator [Armatimonadetes bacterium]|nr:LacI family DNA-binding transcriptional regulator [Armatimonadota bacterium]
MNRIPTEPTEPNLNEESPPETPMRRRVTLSEIAKQSGTHVMAVSVVLNGAKSNTRVSDTTRKRIQEVASTLNYVPNANARGLRRQHTNTIGVLFNWAGSSTIHSLYSVAVLEGIVDGAATAGYHILLYTEAWKNARASAAGFADSRTDGVVLVAPDEASDIVPAFVSLELPIVLVSSASVIPGVPYVTIDNSNVIALAMEHLTALGHTRIAYIGGGTGRHNMRERFEGFQRWMRSRNLPLPPHYLLGDLDPGESDVNTTALSGLLGVAEPPTAVLASNDDLAIQMMQVARSRGVSVPEQLSVVGVDDILAAALTTPKLTTVRQPLFEMGNQAARILTDTIEGRENANAANVIAPTLVVRESTAAPCR